MFLPTTLQSLTSTSAKIWYLYATLSAPQPSNQWISQPGIFSDSHCRTLCSSSSFCAEYFYTDSVGSVCLFSSGLEREGEKDGVEVEEFHTGRKFTSESEVTSTNYNLTQILHDKNLSQSNLSHFYPCYSILNAQGIETSTTCGLYPTHGSELERAGDGSLCIDSHLTFSCDSTISHFSTSCFPGSELTTITDGSIACRVCDVGKFSLGGTSLCLTEEVEKVVEISTARVSRVITSCLKGQILYGGICNDLSKCEVKTPRCGPNGSGRGWKNNCARSYCG